VGLIPRRLPFTTSNTIIKTFRHAVSLDERRAYFKANLWNHPTPEEAKLGIQKHGAHPFISLPHRHQRPADQNDDDGDEILDANESRYSTVSLTPTDVYEVWFAGCHCGMVSSL
jgi:uncharacterized protein (DUF2235 family)